MSKGNIFGNIHIKRIQCIINNRGFKSFITHSVRRIGASREILLMGPDILRINPVGYLCNHSCPICWLHQLDSNILENGKTQDKKPLMTPDDYKKLFSNMPAGLHEVNVVGGGEPLIYKDILQILTDIKKHGWKGSIITNGTLLTPSLIQEFINIKWDVMRVSVHAGDSATYKKIHGIDNFDRLLNAMKSYNTSRHLQGLEKQCKIVVFHVIQRDNLNSINRLFEIAEKIGADAIEFDPVIPFNKNHALEKEELELAAETIDKYARLSSIPSNHNEIKAQLIAQTQNVQKNTPFVPARSCSVGFDQTNISSSGDVYPCCFSNEIMGNVLQKPFSEIWRGTQYCDFRKRLIQGKFAPYCIRAKCSLPGVLHH
jgi:MoaA/NifB/PqqE/SkfB family radical SAM enzyme